MMRAYRHGAHSVYQSDVEDVEQWLTLIFIGSISTSGSGAGIGS
jgi:hypothetical protein